MNIKVYDASTLSNPQKVSFVPSFMNIKDGNSDNNANIKNTLSGIMANDLKFFRAVQLNEKPSNIFTPIFFNFLQRLPTMSS